MGGLEAEFHETCFEDVEDLKVGMHLDLKALEEYEWEYVEEEINTSNGDTEHPDYIELIKEHHECPWYEHDRDVQCENFSLRSGGYCLNHKMTPGRCPYFKIDNGKVIKREENNKPTPL